MVLGVDALIDRLSEDPPRWTTTREGGGMSGTSVLLRALVEKSGRTVDQIKAFLKDKTPAQKMALRNEPTVKVIVPKAAPVTSQSEASLSDLEPGSTVVIQGETADDGTMTATSVAEGPAPHTATTVPNVDTEPQGDN